MKSLYLNRPNFSTLMKTALLIIIILTGLNLTKTASGLGTNFFDDKSNGSCDLGAPKGPPDTDRCNLNVRLASGQTSTVPQTQTYLRAYFQLPSEKDRSGNLKYDANGNTILDTANFPNGQLHVYIYGYNFCPGNPIGNNSRDNLINGHYANNPGQLAVGSNVTKYQVGQQTIRGQYKGGGSSDCNPGSGNYTAVVTLNANDMHVTEGVAKLYYAEIHAEHLSQRGGACTKNNDSGCDGITNSFTVEEQSNNPTREDVIATASNNTACGDDGLCTTVRTAADYASPDDFMTYRMRFGSDCHVDPRGADKSMSFFDLDFDPANPIKIRIHDESTGQWLGAGNGNNWQANEPSYNNSHSLDYVNGKPSTFTFKTYPGHKYVAEVLNVQSNLTMQYSTPYDGIYYEHTCNPGGNSGFVYMTPLNYPTTPQVEVTQPGYFNTGVMVSGLPNGKGFNMRCSYFKTGGIPIGQEDVAVTANGGPYCTRTLSDSSNSIATNICTTIYPQATSWIGSPPGANWFIIGTPENALGCEEVVGLPYFKVYGGDVRTGGGVGVGKTSCQTSSTASIAGWSHPSGTGSAGSGTQLAAYSTGWINLFLTGQYNSFYPSNPTHQLGTPPRQLAFADTSRPPYGLPGYYGASPACTGYVEDLPAGTPEEVGPVTLPDAQTPNSLGPGSHIRHIKGDVYITGDIKYRDAAGGYGSLAGVPKFQLIVEGNIYIDYRVKQLDGLFVAVPPDTAMPGTGGQIHTCYIFGAPAQSNWNGCVYQLVVNGSFAAGKIYLERDCGSQIYATGNEKTTFVGDGNDAQLCNNGNHAAEIFNYTPEQWLYDPGSYSPSGYDSIRNMPPVL